MTKARLTWMLLEDRRVAHERGQAAAAGAITERLGRLYGFSFDPARFTYWWQDPLNRPPLRGAPWISFPVPRPPDRYAAEGSIPMLMLTVAVGGCASVNSTMYLTTEASGPIKKADGAKVSEILGKPGYGYTHYRKAP